MSELQELYEAICEMSERSPLALAMRNFEERDGTLIHRPQRRGYPQPLPLVEDEL